MSQSDMARDYWVKFRASFQRNLEDTTNERFRSAWHSEPPRTVFYVKKILPQVDADLKL